jgi:hypothetical protein
MSLYAGLSPQQALAKWYAIRQKPQDQLTPEEQADIRGNMTGLSQENPAAWTMVRTGTNNTGKTTDLFNPQTGSWDTTQNKGFWSHPESWFQVLAGAGLGSAAAIPAILGSGAAAGGGIPAGTAATASGAGGTLPATGFIGAGGAVPSAASLAPGATTAATAAGGGSALSKAMKYLAPGLAGASVIGGLAKGSGANHTVPLPPELQQMLALQNSRMQSQQPLYDAITKMALHRLPSNYTGGA